MCQNFSFKKKDRFIAVFDVNKNMHAYLSVDDVYYKQSYFSLDSSKLIFAGQDGLTKNILIYDLAKNEFLKTVELPQFRRQF